MKAIQTRYHGPTDRSGARIRANAGKNSATIPYPYELSGEACHAQAALALCAKLEWKGDLIGGGLEDGSCVFVFAEDAGGQRYENPTGRATIQG